MSEKDLAIKLIDRVPRYKLGYVIAYLEGLTADEDADDEFCEQLYKEYEADPDKGDFVPFEEVMNPTSTNDSPSTPRA